ncbi:hypothetical protein [Cellulomonas shaoxiangyii]|uniref:hypothetical protein n=1 Tax=Cellulomonas shaoxiangyii TaxID=2566013 RepID=UPI0014087568|nr:hypothetical protein [Cellulomonas shaoxiangyii]
MGYLGKAMKSGLAIKAAQIARREMSKPENQRKAKELVSRLRNRGGARPSGRP